jgi:large conductance mechanosensitive channel
MSLLKNFEDFIADGKAIDVAVGIVVGGAFGRVVSSLVSDIIMPPIGKLLGAVPFQSLFINLSRHRYPTLEAAQAAGAPTINYGVFLQNFIDFMIIAFAMFIAVRTIRMIREKRITEEVKLLSEIKDLLSKRP